MRILLIADETPFFHPNYVRNLLTLLKNKEHKLFGAVVTKIQNKNNMESYFKRNFLKLHFFELFLLGSIKIFSLLFALIFPWGYKKNNFSVKSAFRSLKIPCLKIKNDINLKEYIEKIKGLNLDLIISSTSLYFGKEILELPKLGCINRHCALLPSYKGFWPIFQAIAHGEKEIGVTIHKMTTKIDSGIILTQQKSSIGHTKNLYKIYKMLFPLTPKIVTEAIDNLIKDKSIKTYSYKESYFTFPTNDNWHNFRKNGGKII